MSLLDSFPNSELWQETTRIGISKDEVPLWIREKLSRKSEYNFSETVDDDTAVQERKVSGEYVREQARKFNRTIKRRSY